MESTSNDEHSAPNFQDLPVYIQLEYIRQYHRSVRKFGGTSERESVTTDDNDMLPAVFPHLHQDELRVLVEEDNEMEEEVVEDRGDNEEERKIAEQLASQDEESRPQVQFFRNFRRRDPQEADEEGQLQWYQEPVPTFPRFPVLRGNSEIETSEPTLRIFPYVPPIDDNTDMEEVIQQ